VSYQFSSVQHAKINAVLVLDASSPWNKIYTIIILMWDASVTRTSIKIKTLQLVKLAAGAKIYCAVTAK